MGIRHTHIECSECLMQCLTTPQPQKAPFSAKKVSYYPLPRGKDVSLPKRVKFLSLGYGRAQNES